MAHAKAYLTSTYARFEPSWEVRSATEQDMRVLAPRLAHGSLDELAALTPFQPLSFLLKDFERKSVIVDKSKPAQPIAVLDVAPTEDPQVAHLWSALTDYIVASDAYWSMSEHANGFLNNVNRLYPTITTYVDARNVRHLAWLERIGFVRTHELPQYGRKAMRFYVYTRTGTA